MTKRGFVLFTAICVLAMIIIGLAAVFGPVPGPAHASGPQVPLLPLAGTFRLTIVGEMPTSSLEEVALDYAQAWRNAGWEISELVPSGDKVQLSALREHCSAVVEIRIEDGRPVLAATVVCWYEEGEQ